MPDGRDRLRSIDESPASARAYGLPLPPFPGYLPGAAIRNFVRRHFLERRTWRELGVGVAHIEPPEVRLEEAHGFILACDPDRHQDPHRDALDFLVPEGTLVLAADDGEVVEVVEHHTAGGPLRVEDRTANYVTLQHGDDEFTHYGHLAPESPREFGIRYGDRVVRGQPIGRVGRTGWTERPQLRFLVFRRAARISGFAGLRPRFA